MDKQQDKRFKALGNKHRLEIFQYIRKHELSCDDKGQCVNVGDVAKQFDLALSTVSHHLKVLYDAGLITCEQNGQQVFCSINRKTVDELRHFFAD
jgi:ArsR family transcriptional regulator, arsenate/arsenite/antimonite-responsive transcriptional repressor